MLRPVPAPMTAEMPADDFLSSLERESEDEVVETQEWTTISEEDAVAELGTEIDAAVDFMGEFSEDWESAQRYFDGGSDIEVVEGRSKVVHTAVRNAIRGAKPSILRVLTTTTSIVKYKPYTRLSADLADAQSLYVNNLFFNNGGYTILSDLLQNAMLQGLGPVMWYYKEEVAPEYMTLSGLSEEEYQALEANPQVRVLSAEAEGVEMPSMEPEVDPTTGQPVAPAGATVVPIYTCEIAHLKKAGKICIESVPLPDFFISRNASSCSDARVVGYRRNMRVGDVMLMGIPYSELEDLDSFDPETSGNAAQEATLRRKANKEGEQATMDPMMAEVAITQVYSRFDLDGIGVPQLWRFILGGTNYELLSKERVSRVQMCLARIDFIPHSAIGSSLYDITKQDQDSITSVMRGSIDNLHMANNQRLVVTDQLVNMVDVLNRKIGAPIRARAPGHVMPVGVTSQIGASLPMMQFMMQQSENRVGVTAAAMGLDPDALQSTDKDAVRNTIQLSQGQIELMTRNFAESLVPMFEGLLELSMRHLDRFQPIMVGDSYIGIDQNALDPSLVMCPNVGLGTDSIDVQRAMLAQVLTIQQGMITQYGPSNPVCNLHHVANTLEDMAKLNGIGNAGRYFTYIDAQTGAQLAEQAATAAAESAEAEKLAAKEQLQSILQVEAYRSTTSEKNAKIDALAKQRLQAMQLQFDALAANAKDDLERDKLAQQRILEMMKMMQDEATHEADNKIKSEQNASRKPAV